MGKRMMPEPGWDVKMTGKQMARECGFSDVHFDDLHDGFPEADIELDFDGSELNAILKKNLERNKDFRPMENDRDG